MAATTSTDWVSYYRANRVAGYGETIKALHVLDHDELADIAKNHNNDSSALWTTIASSRGTNFLLAPGPKGIVKFLHHRFSTSPPLTST